MWSRLALKPQTFRRTYCARNDIFHPSEAHKQIRETIAAFAQNEVAPQVRSRVYSSNP